MERKPLKMTTARKPVAWLVQSPEVLAFAWAMHDQVLTERGVQEMMRFHGIDQIYIRDEHKSTTAAAHNLNAQEVKGDKILPENGDLMVAAWQPTGSSLIQYRTCLCVQPF